MYAIIVSLLLFVLPLASILIEFWFGAEDIVSAAGKWFVFWAVGVRLVLAGFKQVSEPRYTATELLGLKDENADVLVREVGFGNLAMGTLGLVTLLFPTWLLPAALVGGILYSLAGLGHAARTERNSHEQMAMVTDLFAGALLLAFVAATI